MSMQKAGVISTHWPAQDLTELVRQAEPSLVFELVPTSGNPGEAWYTIMVEAESHAEAIAAGDKVRAALNDLPTGPDRTTVFAPQ